MNIRTLYAISTVALPLAGIALAATLSDHRDGIVRIDAAKGIALVRDAHTGRVMAFRASAADLGKMKVGDEIKANWKTGALTEIKGVARTLPLIAPDYGEPCCSVVAVLKDRATVEALLGGILANVQADPAEPVGKPTVDGLEPVNTFRGKIKGVDAVKGVQADFGGLLNGADPVNGIVVARDNKTGALHVLNLSVLSANEAGQVSAPITNYGDMELHQKGDIVTGKYDYKDGVVEGLVTDNVLRLTWMQKVGKLGGAGKLKLSESGNGFVGSVNQGSDPDAAGTAKWGGVRKGLFPGGAQGGSFAGSWETSSGNMVLTQKGDLVRGTFEKEGGHIDGIVRGGVLRLTWIQTGNNMCGSASFKLSLTGNSFTGTYSDNDDPDKVLGTWTGTRG